MNISTPCINKCFEASTGHITKEDSVLLNTSGDNGQDALCVYAYGASSEGIIDDQYGYFIHVPLDEPTDFLDTIKSAKQAGYSEALCNLMELARRNDCKYLQLDRDGVEYDDLPKHNW